MILIDFFPLTTVDRVALALLTMRVLAFSRDCLIQMDGNERSLSTTLGFLVVTARQHS